MFDVTDGKLINQMDKIAITVLCLVQTAKASRGLQ
jgi:hypothetical protein